jgi:ionotropic glutamate receptor
MENKDPKIKKKYVGYCIDLLEELKNLMNFDYELYVAPDGQYGRMNEQSEWNGMVKELMEKVLEKHNNFFSGSVCFSHS